MEPSKQQNPLFAWPTLVILGLMAAGLWIARGKLESDRPPAIEGYPPLESDHIKARLWQDPIVVATTHERAHRSELIGEGEEHRLDKLKGEIQKFKPSHTVFVTVRGGDSSEEREWRLRMRYAVVMALLSQGYTPVDAERIDYFRLFLNPPRKPAETPKPTSSDYANQNAFSQTGNELYRLKADRSNLTKGTAIGRMSETMSSFFARREEPPTAIVPFEWFEPVPFLGGATHVASKPRVLVLWLAEPVLARLANEFSAGKSLYLDEIVKELGLEQLCHFDARITRLIGPGSSATLEALLSDSNLDDERTLRIVSPFSTANSELLSLDWREDNAVDTSEAMKKGVRIKRKIGSDWRLAELLLHELSLRGIKSDDPIALICESDSFYGRAFPLTFAAASQGKHKTSARSITLH